MSIYTNTTKPVNDGNGHRHRRRSPRRHFRNQQRTAVIRAVTAARLYASGAAPTLSAAATACGSNVHYIAAAVILLRAEDSTLLDRALRGAVPLLAAANQAKRVACLVDAYRAASADDLVAFTRIVGPASIWDNVIAPVI
jgi:hypothetical protein